MSRSKKTSLWQKLKQLLSLTDRSDSASATPNQAANTSQSIAEPNYINDLDNQAQSSTQTALINHTNSIKSALTKTHTPAKDPNPQLSLPAAIFKPSLESEPTAHTDDHAPITQQLQAYLKARQWHYTHHPAKPKDSQLTHHLSLKMKNDHINWVCLFRIQEQPKLLAVYGILPFAIPASHRSAAMLLATQLNYDMILGNIELDLSDGELRYKASVDIEATGMNDAVIGYLIQSVIAMTTVSHELFGDLLSNPTPPQDINQLLDDIHQRIESRAFFLASQQIQ